MIYCYTILLKLFQFTLSLVGHKNVCFPIPLLKLAAIDLQVASTLIGKECLPLHTICVNISKAVGRPFQKLISCWN